MKFALELREGLLQESIVLRPEMMPESSFTEDISATSTQEQLVERTRKRGMSGTFDRTWQLEVIQVTSKDMFTKLIHVSVGLYE